MADVLYREFCNHIYLGQWELARPCAFNLIKNTEYTDEYKSKLILTIKALAKDPYLAKFSWKIFPCPNYVSLLSCLLLSDLGHQVESEIYKNNVDINIILEMILGAPECILKELSQISFEFLTNQIDFEIENSNKNYEITNESLSALKNAFKENPIPISLLINKMCCNKFVSTHNLKSVFSSMYFQILLNYLKSAESSFTKNNSAQLLFNVSSKIYLLLSLIPDFYTEENKKLELDNIFFYCLDLCKSGILKLENVYSSLLGCSSAFFLKHFCSIENRKMVANESEKNSLINTCRISTDSGSFNHQIFLLWSLHNKTHLLLDLMEDYFKMILNGNWEYVVKNLNDLPTSIQSLFLILSWERCCDDFSTRNVMNAVKMWEEGEVDSVIATACKRLKLNVSLAEMCISNYIEINPNAESPEIFNQTRRIFSCLQTQTLLRVLHCVFGLKNIPPEKIKSILKYNEENLCCRNSNASLFLTNEAIYSGYMTMVLILESIYLCNEFRIIIEPKKINMSNILYETIDASYDGNSDIENFPKNITEIDVLSDFVNKYGCQMAYSKFIVAKMESARQKIKELFPLSFRVEILENIFSMLFLITQNFADSVEYLYDSDQGCEGDTTFCDKQDSFSIHSFGSPDQGKFIISTIKLKDTDIHNNNGIEIVSDHISSKSESANSNGFQPYTFLCNELITRDLLILLKDCTLEAKADVYKLITSQDDDTVQGTSLKTSFAQYENKFSEYYAELPERTSKLLQYINEAIWRYEVVKIDIFQERSKLLDQQKYKSCYLQSQFSTSSSEGTDKESKKHHRRKKHRQGSLSQKDESVAESNIIQCMLSSSEALLRYSLWNKNLYQASQIIQLFKLETSNEAKEVILINDLQMISNKLILSDKSRETQMKNVSSLVDHNLTQSNISSIKNAVTLGLHSPNTYTIITEEISSLKVLKSMDITEGVHHPELLLGSKNIISILLIDIAYVTNISIELASCLLDSADKSWVDSNSHAKELDSKVLARKRMPLIRGNAKTLTMMNSLLKEMLIFFKENDLHDLSSIFWPLKNQFKTLSQSLPYFLGNFNNMRFKEEIINWKKACQLIKEFSLLLEEEDLNEQKGILVKNVKQENTLHMTYKKLTQALRDLRDWASRTICPEVLHFNNYLSRLFIHLHQVTTAALECKNQNILSGSSNFYTSDFSILKESPVELLKRVVLHNGVISEKIEKLAIRMKVDLVRVLAQACLPYVLLLKETDSIDNLLKCSCHILDQGYPIYVLNMARQFWTKPKHPDLVACELLRDIISIIQDTTIANDSKGIFKIEELFSITQHSCIVGWMENCSELAFVDLDLLQTREEKLAFFINVNNVAWLYAIILQALLRKSQDVEKEEAEMPDYFESYSSTTDYSQELLLSPSILERLTIQKIMGFSIGQLGPISLFDLRYHFLHSHLPIPKHLESAPFNKLLGDKKLAWEQYIPILEPKSLFVLIEGLRYSPKLQIIYSEDIDNILEKAMKDYFDFSIHIDVDHDTVILPQLLDWYAMDFSKDDENCLDKAPYEGLINLLSTLVRNPLSKKFQELLSDDSAYNFSENIDSSGKKQLPFSLKIENHPLSLGIMLEYCNLDSTEPNFKNVSSLMDLQPTTMNYLREKCYILTDLYDIIMNENIPEYISQLNTNIPIFNLLKHYNNLLIKSDDSFAWFSSALSPSPDKKFFIQQVEMCFLANKWPLALYYLDMYLEYCGKREFNIELSRQLLLEHISGINDSTLFEPSSYALCISDPLCRANTVLQNVSKWSDHTAVKALKYCLSDNKILEFPDVNHSLKNKLREVTLYKKIVDASEMYGSSEVKDSVYVFNNWQEVADCSIWEQSRILDFLSSCEKYDLAVEWAELNIIDNKQKIVSLSMNLIFYLSQEAPYEEALKILNLMEDSSDCLKLCNIVLSKLSNNEAKLFLVQYIVDNISCDQQHFYHNMLLGLKMLLSLQPHTKDIYADLIAHPYLLLEQMLMNVELKDAEKALKAIENDLQSIAGNIPVLNNFSVNQLVEDYASKSLEVHFLDALLDTSSSSTLILSIEDSFVVDEPFVMPTRVPTKDEWVPDAKIHYCQVCKEEYFNMFNRRHHCRRCGRVVCASCSQHALIVDGYGNVKVRVCEDCYNLMTGSISVTSSSFDKRYRILSSMQSSPRNSPYQENIISRRRSSSYSQQQTFCWILSSDSEQNASVRNEFSYEQAPSLSLCYSILKLHRDPKKCVQTMLNLCDRLLGKIKPRISGKVLIEVDYSLIISMIKSLLVSAKVKCHQTHDSEGEALADLYFQHLDIMKLLVNANCRHLLPREALTNSDSVRKLRDKLLEEERMSLALEVSTKFNLDKSGVWSSWGLFCIRAGDLPAARTKFQQCLKVINDKNETKQENPLLHKIIEVLERSSYAGTEKAAAIYKSLTCLKNIQNGSNWVKSETKVLDGLIKKECLYYLHSYGTHFSTIRFYQRNKLTYEALKYLIDKKCEPDIFIEAIFMPMLNNVQLSSLKHDITTIDPSLSVWWNYLFATCRCLERLKYLNVLYEMQLFMEDYVRAAKSAINFYLAPASSYKILFERNKYLYNAKKHYEKYLKDIKEDNASGFTKKYKNIKILSTKEVESYIEIIDLQGEVARFFHKCISQSKEGLLIEKQEPDKEINLSELICPATLFGNSQKKFEVALMIILNAVNIDEGFELATKIIQIFGLDTTALLCKAGKELIKLSGMIQIPHFLTCVKCSFSKMIKVDTIILECIAEINKQRGDVEDIIKMLTSDTNKINAYLMCDKLKSAYFLAIKLKSALDVQRILIAAERSEQTAIQRICKRWLESNSQMKSKQ